MSFNKGAIEALYSGPISRPGREDVQVITDQPHGAARYTFDVRPGTSQTRYLWHVVWGDAGDYTASLVEIMPDLVVGGPQVGGNIPALNPGNESSSDNFGGSMKFFPVELEAGERYRVEIKGLATGHGTLSTPMLAHIQAPDGSYVGCGRGIASHVCGSSNMNIRGGGASNDIARNVRYDFTAEQDGIHFLKAGGSLVRLCCASGPNDYDGSGNLIAPTYPYNRSLPGTFQISISRR